MVVRLQQADRRDPEPHHVRRALDDEVEQVLQAPLATGAALAEALTDGYQGLWATGDIEWEFGPQKDFSKLVEYELRLEHFLGQNPNIGGVCQYRAGILPRDVVRKGLLVHPQLLVDQSSSLVNSWYTPEFLQGSELDSELDSAIDRILHLRSFDPADILMQLSGPIRRTAEELAHKDGISLEDFIMYAVAERVERTAPSTSDPDGKPRRPS